MKISSVDTMDHNINTKGKTQTWVTAHTPFSGRTSLCFVFVFVLNVLNKEETKREASLGKPGARTAGAASLLRLNFYSELDSLRWK